MSKDDILTLKIGIDEPNTTLEEEKEIVYTHKIGGNETVVDLKKLKANPIFPFIPDPEWGQNDCAYSDDSDLSSDGLEVEITENTPKLEVKNGGNLEIIKRKRKKSRRSKIFRKSGVFDVIECESLNIREHTAIELQSLEKSNIFIKFFRKVSNFFSRKFRRFKKYTSPFGIVIDMVEKNFGTGIASFYDLFIAIIYINFVVFVTQFIFLIIPWFLRTDYTFSDKFGSFLDYNFYIGLIGITSKSIGDTFFFYGGYRNQYILTNSTSNSTTSFGFLDSDNVTNYVIDSSPFSTKLLYTVPYDFRLVYPLTIVLYFFLCIIILVWSIGSRMRIVHNIDKHKKFTHTFLSMWDHRVTYEKAIKSMKKTIATTFREFCQIDEEKGYIKNLTKTQIFILVVRRAFGISVSTIILFGAPIGVFYVTANYDMLNLYFPFTSTIIISFMSSVLPKILTICVTIEKYKNTKFISYNKIIRTYIIKISLLISLIIRVLFTVTDSSSCVPNDGGVLFWQMVLLDLINTALSTIFVNFGKVIFSLVIQKFKKQLLVPKKSEFDIPSNVNKLLYRQAIIWIGTLCCPMLPFLGITSSIILFYVTFFVMMYTMKFPEKPMGNAKGNIFNQTMLLSTLLFSIVPSVIFFVQPGFNCGPAGEGSLVDGFKIWKLFPFPSVVAVLDQVFDYLPYVLAIFLLFSVIVIYLLFQRFTNYERKLKSSKEKTKKEMELKEEEKKKIMKKEMEKEKEINELSELGNVLRIPIKTTIK